jgi:hypothetical protein
VENVDSQHALGQHRCRLHPNIGGPDLTNVFLKNGYHPNSGARERCAAGTGRTRYSRLTCDVVDYEINSPAKSPHPEIAPIPVGHPRRHLREELMSLLEVTDLRVSFPTADGVVQAVRGVSFSVEPGRTLGIVGESGSGKTVLTQSLLGLTPGSQISGKAVFNGINLIDLAPRDMQKIRGKDIAIIFQDPLTSLHPLYKVGWQITEAIRAHDKTVSKTAATERAVELLATSAYRSRIGG